MDTCLPHVHLFLYAKFCAAYLNMRIAIQQLRYILVAQTKATYIRFGKTIHPDGNTMQNCADFISANLIHIALAQKAK